MKLFCVILVTFFLFSCNKSINEKNFSKIHGKWYFAKETYISSYDKDGKEFPPPPPRENLGFNFYSKDSCEANQNFVDLKSFNVDYYQIEYGRKTIFKIEKDSLKIFNRTFNIWESFYIMRLESNNLVLNRQNTTILNFARVIKR